jgi:hypothetical protein
VTTRSWSGCWQKKRAFGKIPQISDLFGRVGVAKTNFAAHIPFDGEEAWIAGLVFAPRAQPEDPLGACTVLGGRNHGAAVLYRRRLHASL